MRREYRVTRLTVIPEYRSSDITLDDVWRYYTRYLPYTVSGPWYGGSLHLTFNGFTATVNINIFPTNKIYYIDAVLERHTKGGRQRYRIYQYEVFSISDLMLQYLIESRTDTINETRMSIAIY